ncbi:MAG: phage portal protein [Armatimonadetes bacterium]|nr:phage portal protein [Armatimonadota bacterium]
MSVFQWLRHLGRRTAGGAPAPRGRLRVVRAKYDAAQTTPDNRRHWANADHLSANAAASADVRRILRSRARYEVANNSYAKGIVSTLANYVVGTGPRLQMLTDDPEANRVVEQEFSRWAKAIGLAHKLRTMRIAQCESGECFALLATNPRVDAPVQLDLRLIEADQVASPGWRPETVGRRAGMPSDSRDGLPSSLQSPAYSLVDGIVFDGFGNPVAYYVLRSHPGDPRARRAGISEYDLMPAESVIHLFRAERPGQSRGIPEITPALPLFAQLRRYTLAVIAAAESAANIAVLMKTNTPPGGEAAEVEPMTEMEFAPNMAVFTPEGWEPSQIKAEQPATTYDMFKREILNEIARCLNMPFNIAAGNSSGYNYASGRLDHQAFFKAIRIDQAYLADVVLDRVLEAWLSEAALIEGYLPQSLRTRDAEFPHQWFWDGFEHVDPAKEASAQATRLASHTTTLAAEYAKAGLDWESELRQRAREVALLRELGLEQAGVRSPEPGGAEEDDDADDTEEDADASAEAPRR